MPSEVIRNISQNHKEKCTPNTDLQAQHILGCSPPFPCGPQGGYQLCH